MYSSSEVERIRTQNSEDCLAYRPTYNQCFVLSTLNVYALYLYRNTCLISCYWFESTITEGTVRLCSAAEVIFSTRKHGLKQIVELINIKIKCSLRAVMLASSDIKKKVAIECIKKQLGLASQIFLDCWDQTFFVMRDISLTKWFMFCKFPFSNYLTLFIIFRSRCVFITRRHLLSCVVNWLAASPCNINKLQRLCNSSFVPGVLWEQFSQRLFKAIISQSFWQKNV